MDSMDKAFEEWERSAVLGSTNSFLAKAIRESMLSAFFAGRASMANLWRWIEENGRHGEDCVLSKFQQGEPRPDGGYRTMYDGKWFDQAPPCECGLDDILGGREE